MCQIAYTLPFIFDVVSYVIDNTVFILWVRKLKFKEVKCSLKIT